MDVKKKQSNSKKNPKVFLLLLVILPVTSLLFLRYIHTRPDVAEWYVRKIFPFVTYIPRQISNIIPVSTSALIVFLFAISVLPLFIYYLIRFFRSKNKKQFIGKSLLVIYILVCIGIPVFYLNFGYAYHRFPLAKNLDLEEIARDKAELKEATVWVSEHVNRLASQVSRNEEGVFTPAANQKEWRQNAHTAYKNRAQTSDIEFIQKYFYFGKSTVKGLAKPLAHLWSYTGITGIYVPFLVESTANTDIYADEFIFTCLHEVAHSYGVAREDEANFLAFYTGIAVESVDVQYASWLMSYTYLNNALASVDRESQSSIYASLDQLAKIDIGKRNEYWKSFEGPVQEVSSNINNTYLKANKQEDGVKSYGRVVDLILAYFVKYQGGIE